MQLDHTRIAIREREILEILDLGLQVTRVYAQPLLITTAAIVVPLMLVNEWLIGWMVDEEYSPESISRFIWTMTQLVFIQAPLAAVAATTYLGQAMFFQQPTARRVAADTLSLAPRWLPLHLFWRGIALAWILAAVINPVDDFTAAEAFLPMLTFYVLAIRAARPYLNEIVLLERNPLWSRDKDAMTVRRRSATLHGPSVGDLLARSLVTTLIGVALAIAIFGTFWFLSGTLLNDWSWGPIMVHICVPVAMWLVAGYFTVVRFLSYLDLRIRREGWEVELLVRAASTTYTKQLA